MKWTEEKINILKEGVNNKLTYEEIGKLLNIGKNPVRLKAQRIGLKSKYFEKFEDLKETKECLNCNKSFESLISENRKFCSHSCSATINNSLRVSKIKLFKCKNCNVETKVRKNGEGIFCSHMCHRKYEYDYNIKLWKDGKLKGYRGKTKAISNWLRKYMLEKTNNTCQKCGWNNRHPIDDKPLVEINHIDGNAENNCEDNLEVLCPNCHSMTHNFKSRNKNSARNRK